MGVFSGDSIGIGEDTRSISVRALKEVLEEETFENIKVVVCAMPVFKRKDNYHYFIEVRSYSFIVTLYLLLFKGIQELSRQNASVDI